MAGGIGSSLNEASWTDEDLKDPKKLYEKTILLNAQREIADKILDGQWEAKWSEEKLNKMLKENVEPYLQDQPPSAYSTAITEPSPKEGSASAGDVGGYFDSVLTAYDWFQYTV